MLRLVGRVNVAGMSGAGVCGRDEWLRVHPPERVKIEARGSPRLHH